MNLEKIQNILAKEPRFRAKQAYREIFVNLTDSWENASVFPAELRKVLAKEAPLTIPAKLYESGDGKTIKALITLEDGKQIESVLMRHDERNTVCVSSQVGCAMGCDFCATGKMGLIRNLSYWEILEQVVVFARLLKKEKKRVTNIVFMGMGEPFTNYQEVSKAIQWLNGEDGLNIGARKISVSTCGITEGIKKLGHDYPQLNLAISLHAPSDIIRNKIMPINKQVNIEKLLRAVRSYINETGRKVMIEYLLLSGINDSEKDAEELADILKGYLKHLFMVNLIVYNETGDKYKSPSRKAVGQFRKTLEKEGIETSQRFRMGHDIKGACGQLITMKNEPK